MTDWGSFKSTSYDEYSRAGEEMHRLCALAISAQKSSAVNHQDKVHGNW